VKIQFGLFDVLFEVSMTRLTWHFLKLTFFWQECNLATFHSFRQIKLSFTLGKHLRLLWSWFICCLPTDGSLTGNFGVATVLSLGIQPNVTVI